MDQFSLDPYEQQLFTVFESHDRENCGTLDQEGLTHLCQTLQLEEQGTDLIKCLLSDKKSRATFTEFKDALLALLGNMQNNKNIINEDVEKASPDREVSPKFVYGSKKYGRRSRPKNDEVQQTDDLNNAINKSPTNNTSVQRSNSQSEVSNSKKRKTNYKVKRCTSLPSANVNSTPPLSYTNTFITSSFTTTENELVCTEEMLKEAWKKLGVGENGYLNQNELILVFDEIGLHKLAEGVIRQLSDKLSLNYNHRISFQELLEALQQDETWFELLNNSPKNSPKNVFNEADNNVFPDSRTFQYVTLGPDGSGLINTDSLIQMWETVGIHSPKELIHELGFNVRRINVSELADVLEKQVKGIFEGTRSDFQNPQIVLLQANLSLYQSEIRCLKNILEQLQAEREKLKGDVVEANNRATFLAQEVDDNHLRMEQNTLNQVKHLEQRQADILKEVTAQCSKDKEHFAMINQTLNERIGLLELETGKLKSDLIIAQKYSQSIESENNTLSSKIVDLERGKNVLSEQVGLLESEKERAKESEWEKSEQLLSQLSALQLENTHLKDRNDEMLSEIESLTGQVASMRNKVSSTPTKVHSLDQYMDENISIICEGVGIGAKRRSECSPTKDTIFGIADVSPRLGKVRKFHRIKGENLDVPLTSSESGFDTEIDSSDSLSGIENEETTRLKAKIVFLEQLLNQHSILVPVNEDAGQKTVLQLNHRVKILENCISEVKVEMKALIEKDCLNCDNLEIICNKLERLHHEDHEISDATKDKVAALEQINSELTEKAKELECCIDLLRTEYEQCEDYWQSKVDEERQIFEQEQKQNTDRLNELMQTMKEYEEQYANQDSRLPTIEETSNLEQQFTDLELEYDDYKVEVQAELQKRDEEITTLKAKLTELALQKKSEESQEEARLLNKMQNFTSYVIETTSRFPDEMPAAQTLESQVNESDSQSLPINWNFSSNEAPSTSSSSTCLEKNTTTPCRPKRTRKHDKNLYRKSNQDKDGKIETSNGETWNNSPLYKNETAQTVSLPLNAWHDWNRRHASLEKRVRHLQLCLRQQQCHNEQTLQHWWFSFNGEKNELHGKLRLLQEKLEHQKRICNDQVEKLKKSDILVKDLFVENSYLLADVRRLEHHKLSQCSIKTSI